MIGGLQGEFGDLDIKYLKQNIPKYLKMSVGNIKKLQENTAALYTERKTLQVSVIRRSGYVYPKKLKRPPPPSSCEISGCKMSTHGMSSSPIRLWDIRMRWNASWIEFFPVCKVQGLLSRMTRSAQGYPDQLHPDSPRGTCGALPYPDSFREKHTALVNITPRRQHILSRCVVRIID